MKASNGLPLSGSDIVTGTNGGSSATCFDLLLNSGRTVLLQGNSSTHSLYDNAPFHVPNLRGNAQPRCNSKKVTIGVPLFPWGKYPALPR